ncbi:unnamed protein product, partial [marine sediment metagenome]
MEGESNEEELEKSKEELEGFYKIIKLICPLWCNIIVFSSLIIYFIVYRNYHNNNGYQELKIKNQRFLNYRNEYISRIKHVSDLD